MSTSYCFEKRVTFDELFNDQLKHHGIFEHICAATAGDYRCLTDGNDFLWISKGKVGTYFSCDGPNKVLEAIVETFESDIHSEHQCEYWGYETQEEWERVERELHIDMQKYHRKLETESKKQILKYVRGEENNITPGTDTMLKAYIAEELVNKNPDLDSPGCREELMERMNTAYKNKRIKVIRLDYARVDDEDITMVQMLPANDDPF